jgi:mono/diheme cytochrome c family protein
MFTSKRRQAAMLAARIGASSAALAQQGPGLGIPVTEDDIAAWDINVLPDGTGLPPGSGTPAEGAVVYAAHCASCHGQAGEGGIGPMLVGGDAPTAMGTRKTIANHWAYATTVFDNIRRSMPFEAPRSLSNDDYYATVAWILAQNDIIDDDAVMNAETLPAVRMPSFGRLVFRYPQMIPADPERIEALWMRPDAADGAGDPYRLRPFEVGD